MSTTLALTPTTTGFDRRVTQEQTSSDTINALLTKNHDDYHLFFNAMGFHNHIVHHMLTIYALGATPEHLQQAFDINKTYQKAHYTLNEESVAKMEDSTYLHSLIGKEQHYHDILTFFDRRMARDGYQKVVNEYLFSRSALAEDLLVRMFAGVWHPFLVFGFGIEFEQPAVIAEGLADAMCHPAPYARFFGETEKQAQKQKGAVTPLVEVIREIRADPALYDKERWQGGASFNEKLIGNAPTRLIELLAQWRVDGIEELDYRTTESTNVIAWIAGAMQRREKAIKVDFIVMHAVNMSIFFASFNKQAWIRDEDKIRMLEWQTRLNILHYTAELAPPLLTDEITGYASGQSTWEALFQRVIALPDDGHVSKMIRALAHGRDVSAKYEDADAQKAVPELPLKGDMWLQLANMVYDSTSRESNTRARWVFGAGNDQAWSVVSDRVSGEATEP